MAASVFDDSADVLYALSPREFTAARDARAKAAKAAGDAETADEIKALRKPTVPAWLANQLVRAHRDEVGPLLDLGAALREATAALSGPQLRQLSRQRNEVVQALVRQARRLAANAGQPVSEDAARALEATLNAALADEDAGRQLLAGRLAEPLQHSGFGPGSTTAGPAPTSARKEKPPRADPRAPAPSAAERRRAERREQAERDLAAAWATAREAADARIVAEDAAAAAEQEATALHDRVEQVRADLASAGAELERAESIRADCRTARDARRTEAEQATRLVSRLQRVLDKLADPQR